MFGLFIIEAGQEPREVLNLEGKPIVFDNGADAASASKLLATGDLYDNGHRAVKCQPRRLGNDAWKARELGRFADGTYVALPWADLPKLAATEDHFAHISTEDGAKIAYTQDASKGAGDIQTRVRPGKYLAQFYSDTFDAPTIARLVAEFRNQYGESNVLLFADTADEIELVYVNGPRSCMAHPASHFDSSEHPCRIYAAGDLAVAYMVRNDEIKARALVWPAKKIFGRIYGDEARLLDLLETASFESGALNGARMTRIEEGDGFICPYIDNSTEAGDNGTHLILGGYGVCGNNQNGLSGSLMCCDSCECSIDESHCYGDGNGNYYCYDCHSECLGYCERDKEDCALSTMERVITMDDLGQRTTQSWGERAVARHSFVCDGNGARYGDDLSVTLADGTVWSQDYFDEHGGTCEGNGGNYASEDLVTLEDGTVWSQDYFDDQGIKVDGKRYAIGDEPQEDDACGTSEIGVAA